MKKIIDVQLTETIDLLAHWLQRQLGRDWDWLDRTGQQIARGASERVLSVAFSTAGRHVSQGTPSALKLQPQDWSEIAAIRSGWYPSHWSVTQAARTLLILSLPHEDQEFYLRTIAKLFITANLEELVTLYQALPLLPYPEQFRLRAAEGVRSNMTAVFNAVALYNPYPAEYFDNTAWNQMVLKALFVGSSPDLIHGLQERTNPALVQMLLNYARERQSAGRSVPPQLWKLVGSIEKFNRDAPEYSY